MADCNITGLLRDINTENFVKDELSGTLEALRRNLDERYVKRIKKHNIISTKRVHTDTNKRSRSFNGNA